MSGSTLCPPGVRHHTRVVYWEILLPVIHTYMLAFYTLHPLRDPQCPLTTFIQGVLILWKTLKTADLFVQFLLSSLEKKQIFFSKMYMWNKMYEITHAEYFYCFLLISPKIMSPEHEGLQNISKSMFSRSQKHSVSFHGSLGMQRIRVSKLGWFVVSEVIWTLISGRAIDLLEA